MRAALGGMHWRREDLSFRWPHVGLWEASALFRTHLPEITAQAMTLFEARPMSPDDVRTGANLTPTDAL